MAKNNINGTLVDINGCVQNIGGTLVYPKIAYQNCAGTLQKIFDISDSGAKHFWEACGLASGTYTPSGKATSATLDIDGQNCTMKVKLSASYTESVGSSYQPYGPYAGYSYVYNNVYNDPLFYIPITTYNDAIITLTSFTGIKSFAYYMQSGSSTSYVITSGSEENFSVTTEILTTKRICIQLNDFCIKMKQPLSTTPEITLVLKARHRNYITKTGYFISGTSATNYTELSKTYEGDQYRGPYTSACPMYSYTGYSGTFVTKRPIKAAYLPSGTLQTASGGAVTFPAPPGSYRVYYSINSVPSDAANATIPECIAKSYLIEAVE